MFEIGRVIGAPVMVSTLEKAAGKIIQDAMEGRGGYVCIGNVHMVTTAKRSESLRTVMERAILVTSDGVPLVWVLRWQGFRNAERVAGPDLMERLCELAANKGVPVYFYGGSPETIDALLRVITVKFPAMQVVGSESPPILPACPGVDSAVLDRIKESSARIVFVGLGCPKQEFWMAAHAPDLSAVLIGVGAAFDFMADTIPRAPLWMQKWGLEWMFRLVTEPRRLWKRYLVTNTLFLWYLAKEHLYRRVTVE